MTESNLARHSAAPPETRGRWRESWPLDRSTSVALVALLAVVIVLGVVVGRLLTDWVAPNAVTDLDRSLARWLEARRTSTGDDASQWGAFLADTPVKIAATAVVAGAMLRRWRRWREAVLLVLTLVFEATAFISITYLVDRPRPPVERLQESPVSSSFPSGHVAAATVYGAVAVVVFWHTRRFWPRLVAVIVSVSIPLVVGVSRMYQGLHFLSDVVAGVALGLVSLAVGVWALGRPQAPGP